MGGKIHFGVYELDRDAMELRKHGVLIRLQEQPLRVLAALVERPGEIVTREELRERIWDKDTFVDFEQSLNKAVNRLRETLKDDASHPQYVETIPRRGYRFIAPLEGRVPVSPRSHLVQWVGIASLAAILLLAALVALNLGSWRERSLSGSRKPIRSLAVLPLANLSTDPEQDYFAEGMTDALITELGKIGTLRVISRQSMMQYKDTRKSAPQIARELNVDAVVEGSVIRAGDRVRISVELIGVVPERHLWANSYEGDLRDVLALHSEMARAVAGEVRATLTPQEQLRLAESRSVDPEVYDRFLKGRYFYRKMSFEGVEKALEYFQQALQRDPSYAPAHAGMALCYASFLGFFQPSKEVFPKARAAALKALEIDDSLGDAHAALGEVKFFYDWDWSGAEREYKRALELNPNGVDARWQYAAYQVAMGRSDEGIAEAKRALQFDPLSLPANATLAWNYTKTRRYEECIAQFKKTLELDATYGWAQRQILWCYTFKGMYAEALAGYQKQPGKAPDLVYLYAASGRKDEALKALRELTHVPKQVHVDPYGMAIAWAWLDKDRAFQWLEKAYEERSVQMPLLKVEPFFDPLRTDPRFQSMVERMNFPL